ncbi:putative glycolipid-binding domain-containing protein [Pseudonocardia sp. DSM 45834]|uniref:Glycolipid-binding domain-containing protein n=1 Tax=Pseudonocardia charpentierae TaxID=3075545 RepID=A0ABU2NIJ5_9PSEU|nr:putative glycolipid-binding domain-containing protein [Pseudonocardia sp. DSM 45834]MDT0353054.1 putative glycolipid-binding domain-containing protein [Pseudonocardia sp. DSM 45834]
MVGLERLSLSVAVDVVTAESTVICTEDGGFRPDHRWTLTRDWRSFSLDVERRRRVGHVRVGVERLDGGWKVDGVSRPDLDGAEEPDLSVTPSATPSRLAERRTTWEPASHSTPATWTGRR